MYHIVFQPRPVRVEVGQVLSISVAQPSGIEQFAIVVDRC